MKKCFSFVLSAMALLLASCTQEDLSKLSLGEEVQTQISMNLPVMERAGYADPTIGEDNDMRVFLIVSHNGLVIDVDTALNVTSDQIDFNVRLVTGQKYDLAAWADFGEEYYTVVAEEGTNNPSVSMVIPENGVVGSNNLRDAYFAISKDVKLDESGNINMTLQRPFGLVKIVTNDYRQPAVVNANLLPTAYKTTINMPTTLSLVNGSTDDKQDVVIAGNVTEVETSGELSYDYIFASTGKELINFTMNYKTDSDEDWNNGLSYAFKDIPLQRNYKTNISGNILTKQGDVTVTIDQSWTGTLEYGSAALQSVAANGGEITLTEDCIFTNQQFVVNPGAGKTVTINLNGKTIKSDNPNNDAIQVHSGTLIIDGDGNVGGENGYYAIWAKGDSKVILNGGNYYGNGSCIQTKDNAVVEINGGYYKVGQAYNGVYFVVNLQDNQPNTAIIKGGQFENFNPADTNTEPAGVNDNFVPEGYTSTQISTDPIVFEVTKND